MDRAPAQTFAVGQYTLAAPRIPWSRRITVPVP